MTAVKSRGSSSRENMLFLYMEKVISHYYTNGQCRTGETYASTLNSFKRFRSGKDTSLSEMDCEMLEAYEGYLRRNGLSPNTMSFYMKHMRAIYNRAVDDGLIIDRKPFRRITTSIERTVKRALSLKSLKRLKALDLSTARSKQFARDMFMFSFYTRGMSFVDIAYLRKKDLKGNILFYRRKKTSQLLTVHWEPCMQEIADRYRADASSPYMLSIIKEPDGDIRRQYKNAMFLINRQLKAIGQEIGMDRSLTMYCARHSWASIARDEGIPVSIISEGMGHDSEKTTQIYLASLKADVIDKANRKILKLL